MTRAAAASLRTGHGCRSGGNARRSLRHGAHRRSLRRDGQRGRGREPQLQLHAEHHLPAAAGRAPRARAHVAHPDLDRRAARVRRVARRAGDADVPREGRQRAGVRRDERPEHRPRGRRVRAIAPAAPFAREAPPGLAQPGAGGGHLERRADPPRGRDGRPDRAGQQGRRRVLPPRRRELRLPHDRARARDHLLRRHRADPGGRRTVADAERAGARRQLPARRVRGHLARRDALDARAEGLSLDGPQAGPRCLPRDTVTA